MLDSAIKKISEEREKKEAQVAWIWGETLPEIESQAHLLLQVFERLGESPIPIEVVKSYLKAQKEDTISDWKLKFL